MRPERAGKPGRPDDFMDRVRASPWKTGLFSLIRRFDAWHPEKPRLGEASRPRQETLRLGQLASLVFAPREIAELIPPGDSLEEGRNHTGTIESNPFRQRPLVRVFGLGMLGPNGPLPLHYTELVKDRAENHHDSTLSDFLDLFHHRFLSQLYRAWAQAQAAAGLDRADDETFSRYVACLIGNDPGEIRQGALAAHARLAAAAHLGSESRHPNGLAATLAHFFSLNVRVEEFGLHWLRIDTEDATRLGHTGAPCRLGMGAIAGNEVPDRQSRMRLVLGPMSLDQYLEFTPEGDRTPLVIEWVRAFAGLELAWELELTLHVDCAPGAALGNSGRSGKLGWSAWLGTPTAEPWPVNVSLPSAKWNRDGLEFTRGMIFEPEFRAAARDFSVDNSSTTSSRPLP